MSCLLGMVCFNPAWDPTLEEEFGDRVWGLIKYMWDMEWEHSHEFVNIEEREYVFEWVRDLARMHNPSWYMPPRVLKKYQYFDTNVRFITHVMVDIDHTLSRSITLVDLDSGSPTFFMDTFEMTLVKKECIRISDIRLFARTRPPIDYRRNIIATTQLKGEYGMMIGRWFYKRVIIPNRRKRAMRLVHLVLSHSSYKSGVRAGKYAYIRNCIASYMTA
jgi:hypothetical protein